MKRIVFAAMAFIILLPGIAQAAQPSKPGVKYVLVQGIKIDERLLPARLETHSSKTTATSSGQEATGNNAGCWMHTYRVVQKNKFGMELWRLTMSRRWCGTYGPPFIKQITSVARATVQPNIKGIGNAWEYKGLIDSNTNLDGDFYNCCHVSSPRAGNAMWATGYFRVCVWLPIVGTICLLQRFPHIWINAHFNGSVSDGFSNAGTQQ